jgi:glucosylceramidase
MKRNEKVQQIYSSAFFICLYWMVMNSCTQMEKLNASLYETSASGNRLTAIHEFSISGEPATIHIYPKTKYQKITGFGGSFTEASAVVLNKISPENRNLILEAYFGDEGSRYSLTRTHINSCDFSQGNYAYAPIDNDKELLYFSIGEDSDDIIPMIKDAMKRSTEGFKIIASPWTAPPWMKDNNNWRGGKLLPEYYQSWALYFSKYIQAYKKEGMEIWGVTVENEPWETTATGKACISALLR